MIKRKKNKKQRWLGSLQGAGAHFTVCLWFSFKFAKIHNPKLHKRYVTAAGHNLNSSSEQQKLRNDPVNQLH